MKKWYDRETSCEGGGLELWPVVSLGISCVKLSSLW